MKVRRMRTTRITPRKEDIVKRYTLGLSMALCGVLAGGAAVADMSKTEPPLPAPAGSKAEVAVNEGMAHYNQGHWDVAKKHFQQAVQADQRSAEAHYDLALTLDKAGDHKSAIEHFKAAHELGKDNPQIQNSGILQAHLKPKH
jgi:Tfp pilus assembly protein PilF